MLPHVNAAWNLARWLTRNDHDAEDVMQDAMLRAYRFLDGLRGEARPWLLAIVRNACFTWLQANRPAEVQSLDEVAAAEDPLTGPELAVARELDRRAVSAAIAALPVQFREVLVLRELEELAYKDIARIAGIPHGTVMSRLARARRMPAESLKLTSPGPRLGLQE